MWDTLKLCDKTRDELFISSIWSKFYRLTWDVKKKTVRQFLVDIKFYRGQISTTDRAITDEEVRDKLLNSLSRHNSKWSIAYISTIERKLDLPATITLLAQYEETPTLDSANQNVSSPRMKA